MSIDRMSGFRSHMPGLAISDPSIWIARLIGALILLVVWASLMPPPTVPSGAPLAALVCGSCLILVARSYNASLAYDFATPFSFAFAAVGIVYITLSALNALPTPPDRPIVLEFIPRHAYFMVLWIPVMAGSTELLRQLIPDLINLVRKAGMIPLIVLGTGDFLLTLLFGGQGFFYLGYEAFFEPSAITTLYAAAFFLYVSVSRKILWPLIFITANFLIENLYNLGMMFNTLTGTYVLITAWVFALFVRKSPRLAFLAMAAIATGLLAFLVAGVIAPSLMTYKLDTEWRALVWRENLYTALQSSLIGIGFGAPYFPLTTENIAEAFRLSSTPDFLAHSIGDSSPIDILYVRGQHSSYVNAFYRMGVLGGGLLILFNVAVLLVAWNAIKKGNSAAKAFAAGCAAVFLIESTLMALHVALETLRYFAMFALSVGLCRAAAWHARASLPESLHYQPQNSATRGFATGP